MFTFDVPVVFTDDTTAIAFDIILDADDPSTTTSPGGGTLVSVTLNRSLVDQVYPTLNGVIANRDQLREAILPLGAQFRTQGSTTDGYALLSRETSGLPGSSILQLLAEGASTREVATAANLSARTIEHRIERLKSRFRARNITQLVALAISAGIAGIGSQDCRLCKHQIPSGSERCQPFCPCDSIGLEVSFSDSRPRALWTYSSTRR